jgi:hypothetical protein
LRANEQWFVDKIASLLAPWGLAPSSGRVYGYLLLCGGPVSVDQIAAALDMSRTGVWNSARVLERFGHVSRYGAPGSKRALYAASDDFATPFLEQTRLLGNIGDLLRTCASTIVSGQVANQLEIRARFWLSARDTMQRTIQGFAAQRHSPGRPTKIRRAETASGARRTVPGSSLRPRSMVPKIQKKA